jgi:hypothetical protein
LTEEGATAHATDVVAGPDGNLRVPDAALNVLYVVSTAGTQTRTAAIAPPPKNAARGGAARDRGAVAGRRWR